VWVGGCVGVRVVEVPSLAFLHKEEIQ